MRRSEVSKWALAALVTAWCGVAFAQQVKADVGNIASTTSGVNSNLAFVILAILVIVAIVLVFLRTKK